MMVVGEMLACIIYLSLNFVRNYEIEIVVILGMGDDRNLAR
jgi:hypothetical protein